MKLVAIFGLAFWCYAVWRIYATWELRNRANISIWSVILGVIGGACIGLLGRWSWVPLLALVFAITILLIRQLRSAKP